MSKEKKMADVKIYVQNGCPFCIRALLLLESKNVHYTKINAPKGTKEREEAIALSGGKTTVPQIFINGRSIGGYDELNALDNSGKLTELLEEKS